MGYWGWTGNPGGELGLGEAGGAAARGGVAVGEREQGGGDLLGLDLGVEVAESELRSLAPRQGVLLDDVQFKFVF